MNRTIGQEENVVSDDENIVSDDENIVSSAAVLPFPENEIFFPISNASNARQSNAITVTDPVFKKSALSFPTTNELVAWSTMVGLYTFIPTIGFYSMTQYAASAVDALTGGSSEWTFLEYLVACAIISPVVLSVSSVQKLASNAWAFCNNLRNPGMLYSTAMLAALAIARISSESTGFTVYNRLNGEVSDSFLKLCYTTSMISATLTNFRLIGLLAIDPIEAWLTRLPPQKHRAILLKLLNDCLLEIPKLERAIFQGEDDDKRKAYGALVERYVAMRDAPDLFKLTYQHIDLWRESFSHHKIKIGQTVSKEKTDLLQKSHACNDFCDHIWSLGFLVIAGMYTSTTYFSGLKASEFATDHGLLLPVSLSGQAIAAAAYSVNTMINFFSLWTLCTAIHKLWQARQEGYRRDVSGVEWARFGVELSLVMIYLTAQMGMVAAFPANIDGISDRTVYYLQLAFTAIVAPALGLFSLSGAFDRVQNYLCALYYRDTLTQDATAMYDNTRLNMRIPALVLLNCMTTQLSSLIGKVEKMKEADATTLFNEVDCLFSENVDVEHGAQPRDRLPSTAQYEDRNALSQLRGMVRSVLPQSLLQDEDSEADISNEFTPAVRSAFHVTTDRTSLMEGRPSDLSDLSDVDLVQNDLCSPFLPKEIPNLQANPLKALEATYQPRKTACATITSYLSDLIFANNRNSSH